MASAASALARAVAGASEAAVPARAQAASVLVQAQAAAVRAQVSAAAILVDPYECLGRWSTSYHFAAVQVLAHPWSFACDFSFMTCYPSLALHVS